jgi:hypothetical protein
MFYCAFLMINHSYDSWRFTNGCCFKGSYCCRQNCLRTKEKTFFLWRFSKSSTIRQVNIISNLYFQHVFLLKTKCAYLDYLEIGSSVSGDVTVARKGAQNKMPRKSSSSGALQEQLLLASSTSLTSTSSTGSINTGMFIFH